MDITHISRSYAACPTLQTLVRSSPSRPSPNVYLAFFFFGLVLFLLALILCISILYVPTYFCFLTKFMCVPDVTSEFISYGLVCAVFSLYTHLQIFSRVDTLKPPPRPTASTKVVPAFSAQACTLFPQSAVDSENGRLVALIIKFSFHNN